MKGGEPNDKRVGSARRRRGPRRGIWIGAFAAACAAVPLAPAEPFGSWDLGGEGRFGMGYRDNVALSAAAAEGSALWRSELELYAFRLAPGPSSSANAMLYGEDTRYLSAESADKEQFFFGQAEWQTAAERPWRFGASGELLYLDQTLDASASEYDLRRVHARGAGAALTPQIARRLGQNWRLTARFRASRQWYREPLDDYWELGPALGVEWTLNSRNTLSLECRLRRRSYDTRNRVSREGFLVPGTSLAYARPEAELSWRRRMGRRRQWDLRLACRFERNEDNGSGYFNYNRFLGRARLRWRPDAKWECSFRLSAGHYDYDWQPARFDASEPRWKADVSIEAEVRRRIARRVSAYARFVHEQSFSNQPLDEYTMNEATAGVGFEF